MHTTAPLPGVTTVLDAAHLIASSAPYLALLVLLVGIAAGLNAVRRRRRADAALTDRFEVELVPTTTFNPRAEEVARAGHHFARIRHAAGDIPPRGAATRLRYTVHDGQMHCYLEGPAAAAAVVRMPAYAEVDVRTRKGAPPTHSVHFALAQDARRGDAR
ncbi:hypothetical protein ACFXPZ_17945 [Streptomyces sp. NPDC059101]|uniref:hypothetical protein n=1 Tax=Streptomyces sp. NPDC059101 TaxID=3346728 RepID=UPI003681B7DE